MHPVLMIVLSVFAGSFLTWLALQKSSKELEQFLHQMANQNATLQDENQFLQQELEIAVSISKRLNEALAERFAGVYGQGYGRPIAPPIDTPPPEKTAVKIGETVYFVQPQIADLITAQTTNEPQTDRKMAAEREYNNAND